MGHQLKFREKIPKSRAVDKIFVHAKHGNHFNEYRPETKSDLQFYFATQGYNTDELIEKVRNPFFPVPIFENLAPSTWNISGGKFQQKDSKGNITFEMEGPGQVYLSRYLTHFETAIESRDLAVKDLSSTKLFDCINQGITSIDSFLNDCANIWNQNNPDDQLIDNASNKVSIKTKINEWIPKISNGNSIDKSVKQWTDFKTLKSFRDNESIHPKISGGGIELKKMVTYLNSFRFGIALLLGNLHLHVGRPVPSIIINAHYMSDVFISEKK